MNRVRLELLTFRAQTAIARSLAEGDPETAIEPIVRAFERETTGTIVFQCDCSVAGSKRDRIDRRELVPENWWEALLERWLPAWAKRRRPIRYREIVCQRTIYHVCPHVAVPSSDARHGVWLAFERPTWRSQ